jgi:CheY-like chemotaxis protein
MLLFVSEEFALIIDRCHGRDSLPTYGVHSSVQIEAMIEFEKWCHVLTRFDGEYIRALSFRKYVRYPTYLLSNLKVISINQNNGAVRGSMSTTSSGTRKLSVLVVDDEELVADSLVQILNMFGFDATSGYSGPQAIDRANTAAFDVLITDVVMSEMTGIEAAIEIRKVLPNCKVLLVSGNNRTGDMLKDANERGHDFDILAKPVHPSVIIDRLKSMSVVN